MATGERDARTRFAAASVARLATVSADHRPHLVPVVFAVANDTGVADADTIYTAVDGKPKSGAPLRRLANIAANPTVSLLVDEYGDDWDALWWVRADGVAQVHETGGVPAVAHSLLRAKYPQYQSVSLNGPVIEISVRRWSSWTGGPA